MRHPSRMLLKFFLLSSWFKLECLIRNGTTRYDLLQVFLALPVMSTVASCVHVGVSVSACGSDSATHVTD